MQQIISNIGSFLWGPPMIVAIMGCGILLTVRSKFFVFRYFGLIFRKALGSMKSSGQKRTGNVSPFEAICVAVGGAVGVGSLGGLHTTLSHPVTSSHMGVPDETRRKMGITPGMIRVSVGIEEADDLAADFENALKVFG